MEKVGVKTFKENVSGFLRKAAHGESIAITSRGHEIAQLVPPMGNNRMGIARETLKKLRKSSYIGDVLSPISDQWEMME